MTPEVVTHDTEQVLVSEEDLEHIVTTATVIEVIEVGTVGPAGPEGPSGPLFSTYEAENKGATTILTGQAVAIHSSGTGIVLASAADNSANCVGIAYEDIPAASTGLVQTDGPFTLADWSDVIGSASLAAGGTYRLAVTAGQLTASGAFTSGQVVQLVGRAVAPQILNITFGPKWIKS